MGLFLQGSACACIHAHLYVYVRVYVCVYVCACMCLLVCSPPTFSLLVSCLPLPTLPKFHCQRGCILNLINCCPLRPTGAVLCLAWLFATPWTVAHQAPLSVHGDSPGKNTGMGNLSFLQGIFPTQELNRDLLLCRKILYRLSYQGSPKPPGIYCNIIEILSKGYGILMGIKFRENNYCNVTRFRKCLTRELISPTGITRTNFFG